MNCFDLVNLLLNVLATVVGGVVLAFLFFSAREKCFPLPVLIGRWHFEMTTESTAYSPYQDMVLRYVALLWREGPIIKGTVEKVYEISSTGERPYVGKNRTRGIVEGYIDKKYLSKDLVYLHITEDGHGRESTHFHDLHVSKGGRMAGRFFSMVADSEGVVAWQRKPF